MADFINPFNFFPLSENPPKRGYSRGGSLTGVIRYTLRTRTPLIIPDTRNDHAFDVRDEMGNPADQEHRSYDFFSYDEEGPAKPVIPGSQIRGMLRPYYEILTNSCMSFVDDEEVLSKRTNEVFKAGLLERTGDGSYRLYSAKDCLYRGRGNKREGYQRLYADSKLSEGQKVYFTLIRREGKDQTGRYIKAKPLAENVKNSPFPGAETGFVIKGEAGPEFDQRGKYREKHNIHIFVKGALQKELSREELATLTTVLRIYRENGASGYMEYSRAWNQFQKGAGEGLFPVYYSQYNHDANIMFSPASITREIYSTKLRQILRDHCSCSKEGQLCPACALFGMLNTKSKAASRSRVRVSDLRVKSPEEGGSMNDWENLYEKPVTLQALSSPKLNNMEFYIRRPADALFWTYDYYVDAGGNVKAYLPEINGRKFYWHQPDMKLQNAAPDKLNATFRPLKTGIEFTGEVYFDQISEEELSYLAFAVNAGEAGDVKEKKHCYKLGHAKPLGYGSIALQIDQVELRKIDLDEEKGTISYQMQPYAPQLPAVDEQTMKNFHTMTDFEKLRGKKVSYPTDGKNPEIFKWFVANHGSRKGNGMPNSRRDMTFRQYMEAMEPELKETSTRAVKVQITNSTAGGSAVWIARYSISRAQRDCLPKTEGKQIRYDQVSEWATKELLQQYAAAYDTVLLPSKTRSDLTEIAKSLFAHVIKANIGRDGKDEGWTVLQ